LNEIGWLKLNPQIDSAPETRDRLAFACQHLGADPVSEPPAEPTSGDPIDDLADIVGDFRDVIWRHENVGPEEALWYFHFQAHWGRRLRELSLYLHALMCAKGSWDEQYAEDAEAR
jgi:hypothetical protein